jgi:beta-lactamase regulating signal transducer with metallopeptidase domain
LMFAVRRASARTRWIMGWIGLIKFVLPLIWFNPTISRLKFPAADSWNYVPAAFSPGAGRPALPAASGPNLLVEAGAAVWAGGAALLIGAWFLRGYRFRRRILTTAGPISTDLKQRVDRACSRAGLAKVPRCVAVAEASGPGIVGIFSTVIILPQSLEQSLSGEEIDSILLHEFTHVRRRDTLLAALQAVVVRLFWFDPVAWLINRSIQVEVEKSCDEAVLDITADAEVYAGGILKIVRQSLGLREPGFAGAAGVPIVARMKNILSRSAAPHRRRPMVFAIGAAIALVAFSGFSGSIRTSTAGDPPGGKALIVREADFGQKIPDFGAKLGALGYASATITSADMATTDFSQYHLIVIPGTQGESGFSADYAKAADRFDRFVQSGGTLLLEVRGAEGEEILRTHRVFVDGADKQP